MNTIRLALRFAVALWQRRDAVLEIARRDFEERHRRTFLGIIWSYIQPLAYILILVLVFTVGLRANPDIDVPFAVFLVTGIVSWLFFSQLVIDLTQVVQAHSYIVNRGDFNLALLHVARIMSGLPSHLIIIAASIAVCWAHGFPPGIHTLCILYYLFAMCLLLLGIGWMTSATRLFVEDVSHVVGIIVQFGFFLTPIFWNMSLAPPRYRWIFQLNPMCYIVNGYRDSMIGRNPVFGDPLQILYFWVITLLFLLVGASVFRRLRPHFAEVIG